jgi:hypothetical protein
MKIVTHACGKDIAPAYIFAVSGSMQVCEPTCRGAGGEFNGSSCLLVKLQSLFVTKSMVPLFICCLH